MLTSNTTYEFTAYNVNISPLQAGVYWLYDGGELIYIGRAIGLLVTIRSRLQSHHRGDEGPCTAIATHFGFFPTENAAEVEANMLAEHRQRFGRLPRCNDVMPSIFR